MADSREDELALALDAAERRADELDDIAMGLQTMCDYQATRIGDLESALARLVAFVESRGYDCTTEKHLLQGNGS